MSEGNKNLIYEFDSYVLDPSERRLLFEGKTVALTPKAFETLVVLVENHGNLVGKNALMDKVWADSFVEEGNLKLAVHTLRKVLNGTNFIETVPKKGYRFNAPVRAIEKSDNLFVERQTATRITFEAGAVDEENEKTLALAAAPNAFVRNFSLSKIILFALPAFALVGFAAYYFSIDSSPAKSNAANPLARVKTIAVLPLKSLSVPPQDRELRVGLTDSIVTKLGAVRQIAVRPTSSTVRLLDSDYDTLAAGKEFAVDSVLEGSVQREGQKLKINLQMVSVADGKIIWADSFTNDLSDVLSGQESVANRVGRIMALNSDLAATANAAQMSPNLSAQELYLKGNYALATAARKIENIVEARDYFEQAIRLDPNFARAHSDLALAYTLAGSLNLLSPRESYPLAERAARRALEIDPNIAAAYVALGEIESDYNWNWRAAEENYERALELAPNTASAHFAYSEFLARMGRFDEADFHYEAARRLDPTRVNYAAVRALHYFYQHRFDEAIAQGNAAVELDENAYLAYLYSSIAYNMKGDYAAAEIAAKRAASITGGAPADLFALGNAYALEKNDAATAEVLSKLEAMSKRQYVDPIFFAVIHTFRGDKDRAFQYLDRCLEEKSYWVTSLKVHPVFDSLRSDARFDELLERVNLAEIK